MAKLPIIANTLIGVIGLGYVGLPLAAEFGKRFPVVGFGVSEARLNELHQGRDIRHAVSIKEVCPLLLRSLNKPQLDWFVI